MRLASSAALLSLLGIQTSPGALKAAEDALDATFPLVETSVESRLTLSTITDSFTVRQGQAQLRLTSGFLVSERLALSAPVPFRARKQEGVVLLDGPFSGVLTVKYTCGFQTDAEGTTLIDVPSALASAHLQHAASAMLLAPGAVPKEKAKAMGAFSSRAFYAMAQRTLQSLHRPRAMVVWPEYSKG